MALGASGAGPAEAPRGSWLYDPWVRGIVLQLLLAAGLVALFYWMGDNAVENLRRTNVASGYDFLDNRAGFDISQRLIPYDIEDSYARAFVVGLLNTLLVAAIGIVFASIIGFLVGIARLSKNWLVARIATVYVEVLRNIPVLLQLLFWYKAVLSVLPGPRQAIALPFGSNLSNRGLLLPAPIFDRAFGATIIAFLLACVAAILVHIWASYRQTRTGRQFPSLIVGLAIVAVVTGGVFALTGAPLGFEPPTLKGFNFVGGIHIHPEFMALEIGLVLYTATFIAEIVRAGILAISRGQTEASYALGLRPGATLRLVIVPQALRIIIPPLTSQYLNLTKNSSLAVAVGYPDLVSVSGTILNQTNQAVEVIFLTMLVYLAISLATSLFMNWFNRRVALVER